MLFTRKETELCIFQSILDPRKRARINKLHFLIQVNLIKNTIMFTYVFPVSVSVGLLSLDLLSILNDLISVST